MDAIMSVETEYARGKAAHRRRLADLPYPEKVRIVVELQKIAAPILKARGVTAIPRCLTTPDGERNVRQD